MECGDREFQCVCYGFSPLLVPNGYCQTVPFVFLITLPLLFDLIIVGLIHIYEAATQRVPPAFQEVTLLP